MVAPAVVCNDPSNCFGGTMNRISFAMVEVVAILAVFICVLALAVLA